MISIRETIPKKLSGLSSLTVTFDYNPDTVIALKGMPTFNYDKNTHEWELPLTCLAQLLDALTFIDDIKLELMRDSDFKNLDLKSSILLPDGKEEIVSEFGDQDLTAFEKAQFKQKLFKHQLGGINFGLNTPRWLLLDEQGLGKSAEIICLAETLKNRGEIDHCLIICGVNSLKSNWKAEVYKFSHLTAKILGERKTRRGNYVVGSVEDRINDILNPIDEFFVITNIETLRNEKFVKAITGRKCPNVFGMIACDEIHKANNKTSQQAAGLLKLKAKYMIGATGTLLTANPISAYLPLYWIGQDHSTLTNFKSTYCQFGGFNNAQIIGYKNLGLLKEELYTCSLRRVKAQLKDLPSKLVGTELVDMSPEHMKFYEAIKEGIKEEADKIDLKSANLLALTTRLRQATVCPELLTSQKIVSSKIERCVEKVQTLVESGEKVVIMSSFKEPLNQLMELLADYKPLLCSGDTPDDLIAKYVEQFQTDTEHKVILCSYSKMGTGWSLNAASYMICLDEQWTYAQNSQAHDRIHRVNNTLPAFITTLICKDTIDERVHEVSEYKKELSDYLVDGVDNEIAKNLQSEMARIISEL